MRVSVVIPCYNQGPFLAECLESVRAQTLAAHEIIVVDDGSTDPYTVARIDELCRAPIVLVRQKNGGLPAARNAGIARATGDWVLPLDADDQLVPEALETYAQAVARRPDVDLWYPDLQHFGLEHDTWRAPPFNRWRLLQENLVACSSLMRRSLASRVRYNEAITGGFEDWEFTIHACCEEGATAAPLGKAVFRYRRWGYSMVAAAMQKRTSLEKQIRAARPIYSDETRLATVKREEAPCFRVATADPVAWERARTRQSFDDLATTAPVVPCLTSFEAAPGRWLWLSFDDAALLSAMERDPLFVERLAYVLDDGTASLVWLVAGPDQGLRARDPREIGRDDVCVGAILPARLFASARTEVAGGRTVVEALARFSRRLVPTEVRWLAVGPSASARPRRIGAVPSSALHAAVAGARSLASRALKLTLGQDFHRRLWLAASPAGALDRAAVVSIADDPQSGAWWFVAKEPPRWDAPSRVRFPVVITYGARRALADAVAIAEQDHGLGPRLFIGARRPPSDQLRPGDAWLGVGGLDPERQLELVRRSVTRFGCELLVLAGLPAAHRALPRLRDRPATVALLGGVDRELLSEYNRLVDFYVVDRALFPELARRWYVSPSKLRERGEAPPARLRSSR